MVTAVAYLPLLPQRIALCELRSCFNTVAYGQNQPKPLTRAVEGWGLCLIIQYNSESTDHTKKHLMELYYLYLVKHSWVEQRLLTVVREAESYSTVTVKSSSMTSPLSCGLGAQAPR